MKLSGEWLEAPATHAVCQMLTAAGFQAFFVGGCVRNSLLKVNVNDVDIATDAKPTEVMSLAVEAGLTAIPTGIDHGTVTVVSGKTGFQITTFRKDIETDGRRAVVAFSAFVEDDAKRRDFTMNALYARPSGEVVDPLGGMVDLVNRRVRFIESADTRIREDFLRILRYFRFHALYGDPDEGMEADALAAIARNLDGIDTLPKERVGYEIIRLMAAPDPAPSVAGMRSTGVLGLVLPESDDRALAPLVYLESKLELDPEPVRRLAVLGGRDLPRMLRFSKKQTRQYIFLSEGIKGTEPAEKLGYKQGIRVALSVLALRSAVLETPLPNEVIEAVLRGAGAVFPVKPADLMPTLSGQELGQALKALEENWITSGFSLDREALLESSSD